MRAHFQLDTVNTASNITSNINSQNNKLYLRQGFIQALFLEGEKGIPPKV